MSAEEQKKEFDPDDPMEIMEMSAEGDPKELEMTIVDEFISMGYSKDEIRALFENPFYQVPHGILLKRGPVHVNFLIDRCIAEWSDPAYIESLSE